MYELITGTVNIAVGVLCMQPVVLPLTCRHIHPELPQLCDVWCRYRQTTDSAKDSLSFWSVMNQTVTSPWKILL